MSLAKSIFKVLGANSITLIASVVSGFILPAVLEVSEYGYYKTFTLYVSYVGFLHFGFVDGIHVKYAGLVYNKISKAQIYYQHNALIILQLLVAAITLITGIFMSNMLLILFSFVILPINTRNFHLFLLQSTATFGKFSFYKILFPLINLLSLLFLIYVLKSNSHKEYIIAFVGVNFLVFVVMEIDFFRPQRFSHLNSKTSLIENVSILRRGAPILAGNILLMLFYSIDRWVIKFFYSIKDFAIYSFAISLMMIILLLITSLGMVFYPYLSNKDSASTRTELKKILLIIGPYSYVAFFIIEFIIKTFLTKYNQSIDLLFFLFLSLPIVLIINVLHVNIYKLSKSNYLYLKMIIQGVLISIIFCVIAVSVFDSMLSIAVSTSLSFFAWYILSSFKLEGLKINLTEIFYFALVICLFSLTYFYISSILNLSLFFIILLIQVLFYRKTLKKTLTRFLPIK